MLVFAVGNYVKEQKAQCQAQALKILWPDLHFRSLNWANATP